MKKHYLSGIAMLLCLLTHAQNTQNFLGTTGEDLFAQILSAPDGNFYAVGSKQNGAYGEAWLLKLNPAGQVIWEKTFPALLANTDAYAHGLTLLPDGNLLLTGEQRSGTTFDYGTALAIKTDAAGNLIWSRSYANVSAVYDATPQGNGFLLVGWGDQAGSSNGGILLLVNATGILQWKVPVAVSNQTRIKRIFPTADGKYLLVGRANVIGAGYQGIFLQKVEPNGTQIWLKTLNTDFREQDYYSSTEGYFNQSLGAAQTASGDIWITNPKGYNSDITLLHYSAEGQLMEEKTYGSDLINEEPYNLTALPDGGWLITGEAYADIFPVDYQGFALRTDATGLEIWRQYYGAGSSTERLLGAAANGNGFLLVGTSNNVTAGHGSYDGWLLRAEADGNVLPWTIEGRVVVDLNNNCQADPDEPPAVGWFVEATDTVTRLVTTDTEGKFKIRTGDGTTHIQVLPTYPVAAWMFCNNNQSVVSDAAHAVTGLIFLVQSADGGCPHTEVGITQPDLVRCQTSRFFITVRNHGAGPSGDLLLHVALDPVLHVEYSSEPFAQNDNAIDFIVPPMDGLQQKTFEIRARLDCSVQISATHAVVARLSPLECAPGWNGPRFAVEGHCAGGEVVFSLKNEGSGAAASTRYRVMADDLLAIDYTDIEFPAGSPQLLTFPADGRTWRVEVEQSAGFPAASQPSATVEGCGTGSNGLHSIALHNAWRFDDSAPEVSAVLAPNTTGVANKVAEATRGLGLYNLISDTDAQEYTARVRNPLTSTANTAEFRFTFSPNLNPRTFQVTASNAPVEIKFDNTGTLRATMSGLQLDTGHVASAYALLRFRIQPFANTPPDSGQISLFLANADAYVGGVGPYVLSPGILNYSNTFPVAVDFYNNYPPEILLFGGRSYDFGGAMAQAQDGSVFLTGQSGSYSDRTNYDASLIKTDPTGRAYWLNAFDLGDEGSNTFLDVAPLPDGGCIAVGNAQLPTATNNYLADNTPYMARIDAAGNLLWCKKNRPAGPQYGAQIHGIIGTQDGNFVLYGYTKNENGGDQFYLKINADGEIIWQQYQYINGSAFYPGRVIELPDGSLVFMGSNESTVINNDVYLEKIDANGNILWHKGYNGQYGMYLAGLAPMADGGLLVGGYSQWTLDTNIYVTTPTFLRFSPEGDFEWEKNPVIGPYNNASITNIIPAPDGGFLAVGDVFFDTLDHTYDILLLKVNDQGDILWWQHYGAANAEFSRDLLVTGPNQLLLWGFNQSRPPVWDLQTLLVRTNWNGDLLVGTDPEPVSPLTKVRVFPNPSREVAWVSLGQVPEHPVRWRLDDLSGRTVSQGQTATALFDVHVSGLSTGVYVLHFPGERMEVQRLVVLR
ncbi:MAG: T9SS type A sorting domain-containing protein [Saprospiraceae bacterium]|nr:T9SS type A sorting domain-containing protein [Saprospiraceae bacterium]